MLKSSQRKLNKSLIQFKTNINDFILHYYEIMEAKIADPSTIFSSHGLSLIIYPVSSGILVQEFDINFNTIWL